MLVPEIALTPQMARRFRGHFGDEVTLWHSSMTSGERAYTWRRINRGEYKVIIGARSAILLPLNDIGLILIDEEQETSYKQSEPDPRYHARDVALVRARNNNATVIMGTATPSLESFHNAMIGKYELLELPERPYDTNPPEISLVDMTEVEENRRESFQIFSKEMLESIGSKIETNEQIILLQNRRGFAPILQCTDCGWHAQCPNCDVSMTYHKSNNRLQCHYCDTGKKPDDECPQCHGRRLRYSGVGTQRVEEALQAEFKDARIVRMDADSTNKAGAHRRLLDDFEQHRYDILLGTQMIAKGLDFPNVTLVGVINADTGLFFPDFRSSERTFQLLAQVSGRSGRADKPGEVLIQTTVINDPSIQFATSGDYRSFYKITVSEREELNYPPFSRLANITIKGPHQKKVKSLANKIAHQLQQIHHQQKVLGPAPAPLEKIRGDFHWRITIKSNKKWDPVGSELRNLLKQSVLQMKEYPSSGKCRIILDIDPMDML